MLIRIHRATIEQKMFSERNLSLVTNIVYQQSKRLITYVFNLS